MITFCPNCGGKLKQSGGVKHCLGCDGKYYILETQHPKTSSLEIKKNNVNLSSQDKQMEYDYNFSELKDYILGPIQDGFGSVSFTIYGDKAPSTGDKILYTDND